MGAGVGRALRAALVLLELPELDEVAVLDVEGVHEQDRVDGHVADDLDAGLGRGLGLGLGLGLGSG